MNSLNAQRPRPRIGLLPTGLKIYWEQYPRLEALGRAMYAQLRERLERIGEIVAPDVVDTPEKAEAAAAFFRANPVDLLLVFPFGYTTGMCVAPVARVINVPIRLLNAHVDRSYDYRNADTTEYLYHEGVCCIPEYAGMLVALGKRFVVRTGAFSDERLWREVEADCRGAAAARVFREQNFAVIGNTYTHMTDMPVDEHRLLRTTGRLLVRPEVEEVLEAYRRVQPDRIADMIAQFRTMYEVDSSVLDEHLDLSARIAVAFDDVIAHHNIGAFGYYWWGESETLIQLRAQSALAVSRLAALGCPGVTEGDIKTAMAMKLLGLLGGGGMFVEFFSMDFDENFIMMGHDGPSNVALAEGRPVLQHLDQHHGKTGSGIGIDFRMRTGPVTLVNCTQFDAGETFKLIYTVAEVIPGDVLHIGNPNCRVRLAKPIHEFMDAWCREGPVHHTALGQGDLGDAVESFAEAMGLRCVRV